MYKPSGYLIVTYFPTYLAIYGTYCLQNWLRRWNKILTQLRFIHNWVITGIQWLVHWCVLVHCGAGRAGLVTATLNQECLKNHWNKTWTPITFIIAVKHVPGCQRDKWSIVLWWSCLNLTVNCVFIYFEETHYNVCHNYFNIIIIVIISGGVTNTMCLESPTPAALFGT